MTAPGPFPMAFPIPDIDHARIVTSPYFWVYLGVLTLILVGIVYLIKRKKS